MGRTPRGSIACGMALAVATAAPVLAWEPTKPIELVIPAGTASGADQMARLIQGIAEKHRLAPRPIVVVNKSGGAGVEGFVHVKGKKGDAHTIVVALSNLFTTSLTTGTYTWRELTPIARLALDRFILWVHADAPYRTAREYVAAVKARQCRGEGGGCSMGGTGSKQEDEVVTVQLEQALGLIFTYVPVKGGGGEVCNNLVARHVDSTVNNPVECASNWKAGRVRPLAVFDPERIPEGEWKDVPTAREALGVDLQYQMQRGIFGPPDMPRESVAWYVGFLKRVFDTPEFQDYLQMGAHKPAFATGDEYRRWLEAADARHRELMTRGGLLTK